MDMNNVNLELIIQQVLASMKAPANVTADAPAAPASSSIPKTAKVAMLTGLEKIEIKEYPMPEVGDDDVLVKVEGCGVCGTDAHEYKRDPFGLIP
ncbi:MAG: alcohol dehydrogenase catalytic domain-containing protein, partial [Clostridia bacterium]|nr:alcohol dehydrogenase catalytic domain-containing protein [Clostridia bacterium]